MNLVSLGILVCKLIGSFFCNALLPNCISLSTGSLFLQYSNQLSLLYADGQDISAVKSLTHLYVEKVNGTQDIPYLQLQSSTPVVAHIPSLPLGVHVSPSLHALTSHAVFGSLHTGKWTVAASHVRSIRSIPSRWASGGLINVSVRVGDPLPDSTDPPSHPHSILDIVQVLSCGTDRKDLRRWLCNDIL